MLFSPALIQTNKKSKRETYSKRTILSEYFTQAAFFADLQEQKDLTLFAAAFAFLYLSFEDEEFLPCDCAALSL
ncbi:hypothetical protein RM11_0800 [Bartonella quintana RM-11]|nr:hypothetical protein RM11_0800 [Bartonella quintana RM-11]